MFRVVLGTLALIMGLSIMIANLFFYERIKQLKNSLGDGLFKGLWTGKSSPTAEGFDRMLGLLVGLFFAVWAILILFNQLD